MGVSCGFVLSWWFEWLVGLLCACGVRRFYGLLRVCLRFYSSLPFVFSLCPCVCSPFMLFAYLLGLCLCCLRLVLLPALFVLVSLWVFVFSFSLTDYMQKERAQSVFASSLVLLWVVFIRLCLGLRNYCKPFQSLMNYRKSKPRKIERYCGK